VSVPKKGDFTAWRGFRMWLMPVAPRAGGFMIMKGFTPKNGVKVFVIMGAGRRCRDWEHAQAADRPRSIVANHANDVT
jgi:hypothetical protein